MKQIILWSVMGFVFLFSPVFAQNPDPSAPGPKPQERLVALDFDNVDIPVLVKFIGELTMKNFVIDEQVRGKVTLFSPVKIPVSSAYDVFLSVLEMKGFKVVPAGPVYQILPIAAAPEPRSLHTHVVNNADVEEVSKVLLGIVSRMEPPRLAAQPAGTSPKNISGRVDIVTDKTTNSLIITASDDDYRIVEEIVNGLDVSRQQVYVEALVAEMSAELFREFGTDLGALFGYVSGDLFALGGLNTAPPSLTSAAAAAAAAATGATTVSSSGPAFLKTDIRPINARAFLHALQSEPRVNVLSTPQLLAGDRQKAEIVVGQLVPFPGGQSQTTGGNVQTTIERKDVGITLRLTPTIMASKKVKLEVFQEISSVVDTATRSGDQNLGPTTNKRSATTNVMVNDGQTAVIGGLMRDNLIVTRTGIPILQSIPLIGPLFGSTSKRVEKTNLLIFITPYIVPDKGEKNTLDAIREQKAKETMTFIEDNKIGKDHQQSEILEKLKVQPPPSQ